MSATDYITPLTEEEWCKYVCSSERVIISLRKLYAARPELILEIKKSTADRLASLYRDIDSWQEYHPQTAPIHDMLDSVSNPGVYYTTVNVSETMSQGMQTIVLSDSVMIA